MRMNQAENIFQFMSTPHRIAWCGEWHSNEKNKKKMENDQQLTETALKHMVP